MIRKPVIPRIAGLFALYGAVFVVLVMIQFGWQGNFSRRTGNLMVTGQYAAQKASPANPEANNGLPLSRGARVYFGGLEFPLVPGENSLGLLKDDGSRVAVLPELMWETVGALVFRLPGGTEISFSAWGERERAELRIRGGFVEGDAALEIPYRPQRSSRVRNTGDGETIIHFEGIDYRFGWAEMDANRRFLVLRPDTPAVAYGAVYEGGTFNPAAYTLPAAQTKTAFEEAILRWRDQSYALWSAASRFNEDQFIAYGTEALARGTYKTALAAVSAAAFPAAERTYESSVYIGGMQGALRSLSQAEEERFARLTRLIAEGSPELLRESHGFEYLAVRDQVNLIDQGANLVRSLAPDALSMDLIPGIFEGAADWKALRPGEENPFEGLIGKALDLLAGDLRKNAGGTLVLTFPEGAGETEFNLRLGKALVSWAENAGNDAWAGIGRSLILSVLAFQDGIGTIPSLLEVSVSGDFVETPEAPRTNAARMYRLLGLGEYHPHGAGLGTGEDGLWMWTTASTASVEEDREGLEISLTFPMGETHYMLIRGIRPFTRLRLYNNTDFRSDPQFERYDSSGWIYSSSEQTLLLKMKHRSTLEHIRIAYTQPTASATAPAPAPVPTPSPPSAATSSPPPQESGPETAPPAPNQYLPPPARPTQEYPPYSPYFN